MQRGILFVDVVCEAGDAPENVMVFTALDVATLARVYRSKGVEFTEAYEVPEEERQFYVFEPIWLTATQEAAALNLAFAQSESMLVRHLPTGEVYECWWNGAVWGLRDAKTGEIYTTRNEFMRSNYEIIG